MTAGVCCFPSIFFVLLARELCVVCIESMCPPCGAKCRHTVPTGQQRVPCGFGYVSRFWGVSSCSCGRLTRPLLVWDSKTSSARQSRRFRLCTSVCHGPGGIRRHRDSQAAVNILWCTISQFLGQDRPSYLSRRGPVVLHDDDL
jgi:hypothetical protein